MRKVKRDSKSKRHAANHAIWAQGRERVAISLEILRALSLRIEGRPTEDALVERLSTESAFSSMHEGELRRLASRTMNEGRRQDNVAMKAARAERRRAIEERELDKGYDHADSEDALSKPIFVGGPGLPKRRTVKVGRTR